MRAIGDERGARTDELVKRLDAIPPAPEPMVEFPATLTDFIKIVCVTESEASRFVKFLQRTTGDSEAALERLAQTGFTRETWIATARQFMDCITMEDLAPRRPD